MKVQVFSDVHVEFHCDGGESFVKDVIDRSVDVVVIAGDLADAACLEAAVKRVCEAAKEVVFVPGNHEFYGASFSEVFEVLRGLERRFKNFTCLDRQVKVFGKQRFVGATLWFPASEFAERFKDRLNDFYQIEDFDPRVYSECASSINWLAVNVKQDDVVVTHHLPSKRSVASPYKTSALNCFFLCDVEDIIKNRKPKFWIHGHTHSSCDYMIGRTRVLCNPFGYRGENRSFVDKLVIDV